MTKEGVQVSIFEREETKRLKDVYGDVFVIHEGKSLAEVNAKLERTQDEAFREMLNKRYKSSTINEKDN